jgi:branched-chain amino acid transport system substrate-binding protein
MVGASTYDSFMLLAYVMKEQGTDSVDIQKGITKISNFPSNTGITYRYTEEGEAVKPVQVQIVQNGEFHYYNTIDDMDLITP